MNEGIQSEHFSKNEEIQPITWVQCKNFMTKQDFKNPWPRVCNLLQFAITSHHAIDL